MLSPYYSRILVGSSIALLSFGTLLGQIQRANAINITFDYSLDSNNFFGNAGSDQRMRLDDAASYFEGFSDQLSSIGSKSYSIPDPAGSGTTSVTTDVLQNEIKIFVGGDPSLSSLGSGGSVFGSNTRGQTDASGSNPTDFAPLIGFISFDSDETWHFGDKDNFPSNGENDFLSVAIHEIAHVMGFGLTSTNSNTSWETFTQTGEFTGVNSVTVNGGNVSIVSGHWDFNVQGTVINSGTSKDGMMQEAALDPSLLVGSRKFLTDLDYAGLDDIGWEVANVPFEFSPSFGIFFVAGMFGTKKVWNTWKSKR